RSGIDSSQCEAQEACRRWSPSEVLKSGRSAPVWQEPQRRTTSLDINFLKYPASNTLCRFRQQIRRSSPLTYSCCIPKRSLRNGSVLSSPTVYLQRLSRSSQGEAGIFS